MSKLLLIDDEADVQYSFQRIFDSPEIELTTASSGEEGLKLIPKIRPDLVLMDVRMSGMTGLETLRRIRQIDPRLLVILMTADATALITGESGTGKELVARAIYHHGKRSQHAFLAVNCAAIPEQLLESELFGHERGAFTGATMQRIGKFEQCHRGTIFLDEIGDMTPATQTKILRVLQSGAFERVGGNQPITVDVRIIAATNRPLEEAVAKRQFREDLFYRLNVVRVQMPALRDRKSDIRLLVNYFLKKFAKD